MQNAHAGRRNFCLLSRHGLNFRRQKPKAVRPVVAARGENFLRMPPRADGPVPKLISQTGVLKNTRGCVSADGLASPRSRHSFWSDGRKKSRFISVPQNQMVKFAPTGE